MLNKIEVFESVVEPIAEFMNQLESQAYWSISNIFINEKVTVEVLFLGIEFLHVPLDADEDMKDLLLGDSTNFTTLREEMIITTPIQCFERIYFHFDQIHFDSDTYLLFESLSSTFAEEDHLVKSFEVHALASGQLEYDKYFTDIEIYQAFMITEIFKYLNVFFQNLEITTKLKEIKINKHKRFFFKRDEETLSMLAGLGLALNDLARDMDAFAKLGHNEIEKILIKPYGHNVKMYNIRFYELVKRLHKIYKDFLIIKQRFSEKGFYKASSFFLPTIGICLNECEILFQKSIDATNDYFLSDKPIEPEIRIKSHLNAIEELSIILNSLGNALHLFYDCFYQLIHNEVIKLAK